MVSTVVFLLFIRKVKIQIILIVILLLVLTFTILRSFINSESFLALIDLIMGVTAYLVGYLL